MLGSNFALLVKSPGDDGQQLLTTGSRLCISLGETALIGAAIQDNVKCLKELIDAGKK